LNQRVTLAELPLLGPLVLGSAACAAVFSWLAPNHYKPWTAFHGELSMAIALSLLGAWAIWRHRKTAVPLPWLAIAVLIMACVPPLQYFGGLILFGGDAFMASLYLAGFAFSLVLGALVSREHGASASLECVSWVVVVGGVVSVGLALYQWQLLDYLGVYAIELAPGSRPYANLAQPNNLALLVIWSALAVGWLRMQGRFGNGVVALLLVFLALGLAMTQSRGGMVAAAAAVCWLVYAGGRTGTGLKPWQGVCVGLVVLAAMGLWSAVATDWSPQPTGRDSSGAGASASLRRLHLTSMLDALARQPWIGFGWNQVMTAQFLVAGSHPASGELIGHSHNFILDLMLWNGIVLGALAALALATWLFRTCARVRSREGVYAMSFVWAIVATSMFEFQIEYAFFMLPLGLLMGAASQSIGPSSVIAIKPELALVAVGLAFVATCRVAVEYVRIEEDMRMQRFVHARFAVSEEHRKLSNPIVLTQLGNYLRFAQTPERDGMSEAELGWMKRVATRNPFPSVLLRYAAASARNGRPDDAIPALRHICKTHGMSNCHEWKAAWHALGQSHPKIAAVPWPD
jgi:Virulence factor membrane-bound polymerase, C-terminal/O-Antigen ligase